MNARLLGSLIALAAASPLLASPASAQTWIGNRKTPALTEIVSIDKTGEKGWIYGQEDVAGDGLGTFNQPEQAIDLRTVYAVTDATRFWARAYVAEPNAVDANVKVFVFLDADRNKATGGPANAPEIDAKLVADPTQGGYEYVLEIRGNGTVGEVWAWTMAQNKFMATMPQAAQVAGEAGKDTDPILLDGAVHGYVQGAVDLALVGINNLCQADIFVRSVNEAANGPSDLDVGLESACIPVDANNDGVPDPIVPPAGCTTDAQCPAAGICVNGVCVLATPCTADTDCKQGNHCSPDGRCVPNPGGACMGTADCGDLVCVGGMCVGCTLGGTECGTGRRCGPSGICIDISAGSASVGVGVGAGAGSGGGPGSIPLDPGDRVEGGACTCRMEGDGGERAAAACGLGLALGVIGVLRRRRRAPRTTMGGQKP